MTRIDRGDCAESVTGMIAFTSVSKRPSERDLSCTHLLRVTAFVPDSATVRDASGDESKRSIASERFGVKIEDEEEAVGGGHSHASQPETAVSKDQTIYSKNR